MLTERTLRKWRKEALVVVETLPKMMEASQQIGPGMTLTLSERILQMTQELLDQHLIRRR